MRQILGNERSSVNGYLPEVSEWAFVLVQDPAAYLQWMLGIFFLVTLNGLMKLVVCNLETIGHLSFGQIHLFFQDGTL